MGATSPSTPAALTAPVETAPPPRGCLAAQKAIRYYSAKTYHYQALRGSTRFADRIPWPTCFHARRAASEWAQRASSARRSYHRWLHYHYAWQKWLPDKWARIGACETGYGRRPGQWTWDSGIYQGAFGFHHQSWDSFVDDADPKAGPYPSEAYRATPRQQYEVALAIYRRYGFSGWGCRGA